MSVNREIQLALRSPKSVPYTPTSASRSSLMLGSPVWSTSRSVSTTRIGSPAARPIEGIDADAVATEAELRLLVHLDLGDHPAGRGIQPGEVDAGRLADQAASSVAADEVLRSERRAVGQLDVDAGVVLREAHHLAAAKDRNPELTDPVGQDGLELALPQREPVVVAGGEVADVQRDSGEAWICIDLPRREEPFRDATLIEHLDGAGVQTAGSRSVDDPDSVRRSTMTTSIPANASSPANISPVGPPPAITTACSVIDPTHPFHNSWLHRFWP